VKGFCEHSNETSDILKGRAFLGELNDYPLLQKHVIPRSQTKRGGSACSKRVRSCALHLLQ